eukprot:2790216-Amphidinium_carterae.1
MRLLQRSVITLALLVVARNDTFFPCMLFWPDVSKLRGCTADEETSGGDCACCRACACSRTRSACASSRTRSACAS